MWRPRSKCQRGRSALHISKRRSSRHDFASAVRDTRTSGPPCRIDHESGVVTVAPAYVRCSKPAAVTEASPRQICTGRRNTKPASLSRASLGLEGRGWQKLNRRRCFETQVSQEGMASAGILANHNSGTTGHLAIHNHRRRKDWRVFVVLREAPPEHEMLTHWNEQCQLMFK